MNKVLVVRFIGLLIILIFVSQVYIHFKIVFLLRNLILKLFHFFLLLFYCKSFFFVWSLFVEVLWIIFAQRRTNRFCIRNFVFFLNQWSQCSFIISQAFSQRPINEETPFNIFFELIYSLMYYFNVFRILNFTDGIKNIIEALIADSFSFVAIFF